MQERKYVINSAGFDYNFWNSVGLALGLNLSINICTLWGGSPCRVLTKKIVNADWFCREEY